MTTPDPFRLQILKAITAALDQIDGTDGVYHFDLQPFTDTRDGVEFTQKRNFRGRVIFGEDDPLPMTSVLESVIQPEQVPNSAANHHRAGPWELLIQGFVQDDDENPTDPAQRLLADIVTRIAQEIRRTTTGEAFGFRAIERITLGVPVVRPPDEISARAYCWQPLTIDFVEDLTRPYFNGRN